MDVEAIYEFCCRKIWAVIKTRDKKKVKELQRIFDNYGLETWDDEKREWEGDGIEIYTFRELIKELEKRGYKVKYDIA